MRAVTAFSFPRTEHIIYNEHVPNMANHPHFQLTRHELDFSTHNSIFRNSFHSNAVNDQKIPAAMKSQLFHILF
jgi:hypothetical protein